MNAIGASLQSIPKLLASAGMRLLQGYCRRDPEDVAIALKCGPR
jgi:hypothetical protein